MDTDPQSPRVVKYSPEIGQPAGHTDRLPGWVLLVLVVILIAFVSWTQGWWP